MPQLSVIEGAKVVNN